jgi:soluble lytic murein transglycosylase
LPGNGTPAATLDPDLLTSAQLGLGKALFNNGDTAGAINAWVTLLEQSPTSTLAADAYFLLGEAYSAVSPEQAISAYRAYERLRPGAIDSYVEERIGQVAYGLQDYATAEQAYLAAISAPRADEHETLDLRERLAETYAAQGNTADALAQYESIYQTTDQNWRKARMDSLAGQLLYNSSQPAPAYEKFLDAVNNYPDAPDTFSGLVTLVNDEIPVDDLQRGLVNYFAANYDPALAAFDRYITANPNSSAEALYYKALTLAAQTAAAQAITTLREIVANYPDSDYWTRAYFQIAFIQPYPDDTQTFQSFAAAAPQSPSAPDALYRAARLCERNQDFKTAAQLWTRIALDYPNSTQAADSAMQAGIVLYRAGDLVTAAQRFEFASTLGGDAEEHARAWVWLGKVKEKLGDASSARQAWTRAALPAPVPQAQVSDPHGYYSLRAAQLLRGEKNLFVAPAQYSFAFDSNAEQAEAEAWLRATFPLLKNYSPLSDLQPGLWKEARFVRGAELWRLGLLPEAHAEFDSLRLDMQGDPLAMWQLALYFNKIGAYDLSIRSARAVVDLAGLTDTLTAPRFILRLRYPAPFAEIVEPAAAQYGLHSFLMLSKMRLESFFWKYAFSSAAARGLNQIIPSTADDIARRLGLENFTYADLYRPSVSIPMGAFYLAFVGKTVENDPAAILAGYYAGPGNAQIWQGLAEGDPDLFVEVIRLPDAKGYVQTAYEYFQEYKELYESK